MPQAYKKILEYHQGKKTNFISFEMNEDLYSLSLFLIEVGLAIEKYGKSVEYYENLKKIQEDSKKIDEQ